MSLLDKIISCYESITPLQATLVLGIVLLYLVYLLVRDMGVPPGPRGSPILGYWPYLNNETCHLHLRELSKKYGDVFSFRVAGTLFINLGSIKAVREAHITKSDCFQDRYVDCLLTKVFGGGVTFLNGEEWKVLRKFFVNMLKEYGVNNIKDHAATAVYDAMNEIVEELRSAKGRPFQVNDLITRKGVAIIKRMMFNDEGITTKDFLAINESYNEIMKETTSTNLMLIGKFARYCMFPFMPSIRRLDKYCKHIEKVLYDVINRHKKEYNESHVADLIDCYFKEKEDRQKRGDPTAKYFTDQALMSTLNQVVTAGIQTIVMFIGNFLVTLVQFPDEQERIYEEICEVIGTDRLPTLEDKTNLQYTNAFMLEVIRFTDFLTTFPSLRCTKETTVQGYKIPAGSVTLLNFYNAHRNPTYFENPDDFNPSRYLPSPGKQRPELPILFGIGKRSCMGEGFSLIQTFLVLTSIVQNFRLSFPEGSEVSSNVFSTPDKLQLRAHPRQHKSHQKST